MNIFGSFFSRRVPVDVNDDLQRKQDEIFGQPRFIGFDLGKDDMTSEALFEKQPDGSLKLISIRRTIDLKPE
jgi:hypothetical protein